MKSHITAIALALASFGAFAQEGYDNIFNQRTGPTELVISSTLTREAVRADLLAAVARGERIHDYEAIRVGPTQVASASTLTRQEVRSELLAAIAGGKRFPDHEFARVGPTRGA